MSNSFFQKAVGELFSITVIFLIMFFGCFFLYLHHLPISIVLLSYGVILIESRIALRKFIKGFVGAGVLVTLLRSAFFFVPLPFLGIPSLNIFSWGVLVSLLWGLALQLCQLSDLKLMLSSEFIALLPPLTRGVKFDSMLMVFLSAVSQEYFYRGVVLSVLATSLGVWAVIVATILFVIEHIVHFHSHQVYDAYDLLFQFFLSMGLGLIFYFSASLIGCILGHMLYNSFAAVHTLRRKTA